MPDEKMTFAIENADLMWLNLEGRVGPYNDRGQRGFSIRLNNIPDVAETLARDGWNVKTKMPREDPDEDVSEPTIHLPVTVRFDVKPPNIVMIAGGVRTRLDKDTVGVIDFADILTVDLACNAYHWEFAQKTGIKAMLKTMYVTIDEDEIERKYSQLAREAGQ